MSVGYLDSQKLTNIANAIRTKDGSSASMTVDQMPTKIANIPSPVITPAFKDVCFFDYDGTLLYNYTLTEAHNLSALPPLPTAPQGYEAVSWTETLSYVQNAIMPCDIGVNYRATEQDSKIYITIPHNNAVVLTRGGTYTIKINWGDSETDYFLNSNEQVKHTYATAGDYVITLKGYDGKTAPTWYFSSGSGPAFVLEEEAKEMSQYAGYNSQPQASYSLITGIYIGSGWQFLNIDGNYNVKTFIDITNPWWNSSPYNVVKGTGIKHITYSSEGRGFSSNIAFISWSSLETVVLPSTILAKADNYNFANIHVPNLRRISLNFGTKNISVGNAFANNDSLEEIYINGYFTSAPSYTASNCRKLKRVVFKGLGASRAGVIGIGCFDTSCALTDVSIDSLLTASNDSFKYTAVDNKLNISGLETIGNYAFANALFDEIYLPNIQVVGSYAFQRSYTIKKARFGSNLVSLSDGVFSNCPILSEIIVEAVNPPNGVSSSSFQGTDANLKIYVPAGSVDTYKAATGWSLYASKIYPSFEITNYKSLTLSADESQVSGFDEYVSATATLICDGYNIITGETEYDAVLLNNVSIYIGSNTTGSAVTKTISYTWPDSGLTASDQVTQAAAPATYVRFTPESIATGWQIPNDSWPGDPYKLPADSGYTSYIKSLGSSATNSCYLDIEIKGHTDITIYAHCHASEFCYIKLDSMVDSSNYDYRFNQNNGTTSANANNIANTTQWQPVTYSGLDPNTTHHIYAYQVFNPQNATYGQYCASIAVSNSYLNT